MKIYKIKRGGKNMLKISSLLENVARKTAADMLKKDLSEGDIPKMQGFFLSKEKTKNGYRMIGKIEEESAVFFIFQKK